MTTVSTAGRWPDGNVVNPLVSGAILSTLTRLAVPNMIAMVAIALVTIAETAYVGALGTAALAGMALVFPVVMLQQMMSGGAMGSAISSAVSRAIGAGDVERTQALAWHAVLIGLVGGLIMTALLLTFGAFIYRLLGGRGEALAQALAYSDMVFLGAVGIWLMNTASSVLRGSGEMRVPMFTALGVALAQVMIGGALGLGLGPFPRWGMAGVALGQVIAYSVGAAVILWYMASGRSQVRLKRLPLRGEHFATILKVGAVAAISPVQSVLTALILTGLIARFGTEALAGYGIGARLEFLLIPVAFAIGAASVPMVGMAMGGGLAERARSVAWTAGGLSAVLLGVVGIVVALAPDLWSRMFTSDPAVLSAAAHYFRWAGPAYAFFGLGLCLYFASQGAGKVLGPVLAGTLRLALVAAVGWWLAANGAPLWTLFALIAVATVLFGLATALAVYLVPWRVRPPAA